jgi:hypothetical protein
LVYIV